MPSNLPPIDFREEKSRYNAFEEKTEVAFPDCKHTKVKIVNGWLRCQCGAGWTGKGVSRLYDEIKKSQNSTHG